MIHKSLKKLKNYVFNVDVLKRELSFCLYNLYL